MEHKTRLDETEQVLLVDFIKNNPNGSYEEFCQAHHTQVSPTTFRRYKSGKRQGHKNLSAFGEKRKIAEDFITGNPEGTYSDFVAARGKVLSDALFYGYRRRMTKTTNRRRPYVRREPSEKITTNNIYQTIGKILPFEDKNVYKVTVSRIIDRESLMKVIASEQAISSEVKVEEFSEHPSWMGSLLNLVNNVCSLNLEAVALADGSIEIRRAQI